MGIKIPEIEKEIKESDNKNQNLWDFLNKDITILKSKFSDKKKERFYSDLYILLDSGIDIKSSIELIESEQKKENDKILFKNLKNDIIKGYSLSDAMIKSEKFSNYEYYSIKIGEESGRLNVVLKELVIFYNKKIKQKRQIINAFSYPILVLITAIGAVLFMMNTIVPMFKDIFKRFNSELPSITKFVIDISDFVGAYSGYFFFIFIVIIIFLIANKNKTWFRKYSSKIMLKLPLFAPIVKMIYLARFSQSMALLISSKTPMLQAIDLVKNMMDFYPYEKALSVIHNDIMQGSNLSDSMRKFDIFDSRTCSLIKVAEEVNKLDTIFTKLNKQFSDELEHKILIISNLLEPIMIIFVGVLVGVILVSMYLPMFQLGTSIYGN